MSFDLSVLPAWNATLNLIASVYLVCGYVQIKKYKNEMAHRKCMVRALMVSALFLTFYLIYHFQVGHTRFPELTREMSWLKTLYLAILIPHIILAVVMLPFIFMTFFFAFKDQRERHKRIAKVTFPIWFFVSVTGVVIYLMLYQIAPLYRV